MFCCLEQQCCSVLLVLPCAALSWAQQREPSQETQQKKLGQKAQQGDSAMSLAGCFGRFFAECCAGCFVCWVTCWELAGWLAVWLLGWLVGHLLGCTHRY